MSDLYWLPYVGVVTGVVGMVTGVAGAVMGYKGYQRSGENKAIDLRLDLRKAEYTVCGVVAALPDLLERSKKSRMAVSSMLGQAGSALQLWLNMWEGDIKLAGALAGQSPNLTIDYDTLNHRELEARLVAIHELQSQSEQLQQKYSAALAADDIERERRNESYRRWAHNR